MRRPKAAINHKKLLLQRPIWQKNQMADSYGEEYTKKIFSF